MVRSLKRLLFRVALVSLAVGCRPATPATDIGVLTFNIRLDTPADGQDAWPLRRDWVADVIRSYDPDLIAFQEALPSQVTYLEEALPDYRRLGGGRDDGDQAGEASPVFYRTDRYSELGHGMWWLSEHPDSVGSRGWDAALPRIATWARLATDSDTLLFVSTHFDHMGRVARTESAGLLSRLLGDEDDAIILAGDFNFTDSTDAYRALAGAGWSDSWIATDRPLPEETFTGFAVGPPAGDRIDYVFTRGGLTAIEYVAGEHEREGRHPSDHRPVFVRLRLDPDVR